MLHIKLTGKEAVALFQLLFVCQSPDVRIAPFPVNESHAALIFIFFRIQGGPEVGVIPYQGLQEELIRAEGIIESFQYKRLLAHHILHAGLRDAPPVGTLGKIHLLAMQERHEQHRKIFVQSPGNGIQSPILRAGKTGK